ncbi:MAG: hypothetical protein ABSB40_00865 [Nitrososphaeria archaeon]
MSKNEFTAVESAAADYAKEIMPLSEIHEELIVTTFQQGMQSSASYVPPSAGLEKKEEIKGKGAFD